MSKLRTSRRTLFAASVIAVAAVTGVGIAVAASSPAPPSNARSAGRGVPEFGMTGSYYQGTRVNFTYTKGFFCDTSVSSSASSKCEAGANYKKAPSRQHDPLYITVPLGFSRPMNMIQCPTGLVCVDHPG